LLEAQNLWNCLTNKYQIKVDLKAKKYIGFIIDYQQGKNPYIAISMPGYVAKALKRFKIDPPN